MARNRVKELRIQKGLTVSALADLVGMSHTHISRIENGQRGLSLPVAERIAKAMDTSAWKVMGANSAASADPRSGFAEDAEPYQPTSASPLPVRPSRSQNIDPWMVKTNALDRVGIRQGMIVFIDISAEAVENLQPLQCVIAQIYEDTGATTVLRQFVPPALLVTNSSGDNSLPLDLDKGDAHIKGVVVGKYEGL